MYQLQTFWSMRKYSKYFHAYPQLTRNIWPLFSNCLDRAHTAKLLQGSPPKLNYCSCAAALGISKSSFTSYSCTSGAFSLSRNYVRLIKWFGLNAYLHVVGERFLKLFNRNTTQSNKRCCWTSVCTGTIGTRNKSCLKKQFWENQGSPKNIHILSKTPTIWTLFES